jgi:D-beta-D-heptose 7-phosphate kinase/D-beta-D-heptose 1-phosphate adenosyltransferase
MTKVLLIGDSCIDNYQYGTVDRISPEAPVPVFKISHIETKEGMAANVAKNLAAFGIHVTALFGEQSFKTRLIDTRSGQHIVRIDDDTVSTPFDPTTLTSIDYDAIVISDYNKGFVSAGAVAYLKSIFPGPIFVDTKKKNLEMFEGCFVKVNEHEFINSTSQCTNLIVTLGSNGAMYQKEVFPTSKVEVVDVCGAGDSFLSALCYRYVSTNNIRESIMFANKAAAISVKHSGVYVLTPDDIQSCWY